MEENRIKFGGLIPNALSQLKHRFHGIYDEDVADEPILWLSKSLQFISPDLGYNQIVLISLAEEMLSKMFDVEILKALTFKPFLQMEQRILTAALKFYCNEELVNAHSAKAIQQLTMFYVNWTDMKN